MERSRCPRSFVRKDVFHHGQVRFQEVVLELSRFSERKSFFVDHQDQRLGQHFGAADQEAFDVVLS